MALTAKQAAYRDARVAGLDPSDAYRAAYNAQKMSAKSISVEANRLENHPEISLAISQANAKAIERLSITAEDIAREAWSIATDAENQPSARVSALTLLAKRHREFSEKHEHEVNGNVTVVRNTRPLRG